MHCLTKRDGVDGMFPFAKRHITEWDSKCDPKNNELGGLIRFAGNSHVYQVPKRNCFIAVLAIGAHKALFSV